MSAQRRVLTESAETLEYMPGFGNDFETEALPGALPQGMNSPQKCNYGLYAEQLSGSPFTAPRTENERSWLYRMRPSVRHATKFQRIDMPYWRSAPCRDDSELPLQQLRWDPVPLPDEPVNFITGMRTITTCGDSDAQAGMATHVYLTNQSMDTDYFNNADAEMLVVPQEGAIEIFTEMGRMQVGPRDIAVIPRGMMFKVGLIDDVSRGYVCENYGGTFTLPDRGPIGANCLANPRDFKTPVAAYEDREGIDGHIVIKWGGRFHQASIDHSPLDVVAWHGNYVPYAYDMLTFSPVGAILFDHPDPSIFTVLTAPSETPGTANVDFILFPSRWLVAENTFRPPWYHRNIMSEFMGLIHGVYDAKPEDFKPGGMSLHNCMLPHGPDRSAYEGASNAELKPEKLENTMAFMFESRFPQHVTGYAANLEGRQDNYADCWKGLERKFDGLPGTK